MTDDPLTAPAELEGNPPSPAALVAFFDDVLVPTHRASVRTDWGVGGLLVIALVVDVVGFVLSTGGWLRWLDLALAAVLVVVLRRLILNAREDRRHWRMLCEGMAEVRVICQLYARDADGFARRN